MAGDANYASVSLLLHCDGTNGSTTFTDSSPTPKTITRFGDAQISTAQSKFGGSSIRLDGTGDYINAPSGAAFSLDADYTFEVWVYPLALAYACIFDTRTTGPQLSLTVNLNDDGSISTYLHPSNYSSSGASYAANAWNHIAVSRSGSTGRFFINGTLCGTYSHTVPGNGGNVCRISGNIDGNLNFNGYLDDIRITKGVARYTGNFTPPAAAFDDRLPQVSGNVKDASGANAARTVRAYRRDTGALVGSATSNGTTGNYTIDCATDVEVTVIAFDNATSGTYYNDQAARVIPA